MQRPQRLQRLQRFKWIPMLLRAWNEARERTEAARTDAAAPGPVKADPQTNRSSPAKQTRTAAKSPGTAGAPARPAARRRPVRRLKGQVAPVPGGRRLPLRRIDRTDYHAVLRELREAKQQLSQLDSIRSQLDGLQQWFEQRMAAQGAADGSRAQSASHLQGQRQGMPAAGANPYVTLPYPAGNQEPPRTAPAQSGAGVPSDQATTPSGAPDAAGQTEGSS